MINYFKNKITPQRLEIALKIWVLLIPFGAFILPVSVGFMTLYPLLILTVILAIYPGMHIIQLAKQHWVYPAILALFLVHVLVVSYFQNHYDTAVFYFRSYLVQLLIALVLMGSYYRLGWERFKGIALFFINYTLVILLFTGVFEHLTGIHLAGHTTEKYALLEPSHIFYSPLFIYDNSNDFVMNFLLMIVAKLWVSRGEINHYQLLILGLVCFFFAYTADSRFGEIGSALIILFALIQTVELPMNWKYFVGGLVLSASLFVFHQTWLGPHYLKYDFAANKELIILEADSVKITQINQLNPDEQKRILAARRASFVTSDNIRKNLILNGFQLIKSKPILGYGVGGFAYETKHNPSFLPTGTVQSPHNFFIELISQFGVLGWAYLVFLGLLFWRIFKLFLKEKQRYFIVLPLAVIGLCFLMPSTFITCELWWYLLPIFIIASMRPKTEQHGS